MTEQPVVAYPGRIKEWVDYQDNRDVVRALHVNTLQDEAEAVQKTLGVDVHITKHTGVTVYYPANGARPANTPADNLFVDFPGVPGTIVWNSVDERIANLEKASLRNMSGAFVSTLGGSVVDPTLNGFRTQGTGGVMLKMATDDFTPALSVQTTAAWGDPVKIGLYGSGRIVANRIELGGVTLNGTGGDNAVQVGNLIITGLGDIVQGSNRYRVDPQANQGYQDLRVSPVAGADTIRVNGSTGGGLRGVLRVYNGSGGTVFLLDSDGNITCKSINSIVPIGGGWDIDGVSLTKDGLVFHAGGAYRPNIWVLKDGGSFDGTTLAFKGGSKLVEHTGSTPKNLTLDAPMTLVTGGLMAQSMTTCLYEVSGSMVVPIPKEGAGDAPYDFPYNKDTTGKVKRKPYIPFDGPPTGAVEIVFSAEVRSYSRPVWVSYRIFDTVTGQVVYQVSDTHSVMNNGARAQSEQTDVDQTRGSNPNLVTGLKVGGKYQLQVMTRAADLGPGDHDMKYAYVYGVRALIRPVMTKILVGVVDG